MFRPLGGVLSGLFLVLATACGDAPVMLNGGGATFPYPLYSRWTSDYLMEKGVEVNYQSQGSGAGIRQLQEQTFDFGGSDGPMSDEQLAQAGGGEVLHIPAVLGGVAVAYTIPNFTDTLNFDSALIADIFLGRITRWNDARIAALNPQASLPDMEISVVYRGEGSGTTYVFTDYLTKVSTAWAAGPGRGTDVPWPIGMGAKGNEQVAGQVKATPGAIGYIESVYALQTNILVGRVKNAAGNFVAPTQETISAAAAEAVAALPEDTDYRISIVDAPGANAYPISSFTWFLVYKNQTNAAKGEVLKDFLSWAVTEGQKQAGELNYGPLPELMRPRLLARIESIKLP